VSNLIEDLLLLVVILLSKFGVVMKKMVNGKSHYNSVKLFKHLHQLSAALN